MTVLLRPGQASLADWHALYRGAGLSLDPVCRADVEAGSAALQAIGPGDPATATEGDGGPTVIELLHKNDNRLPAELVRLFAALKLTSLAQGAAGVRWSVVQALADCLDKGLMPAVPANATDRLALSHLFGVLTGTGEVVTDRRRPAAKALRKAGLTPVRLSGEERGALLSGTQLSLASALAGLFEAERVLQSSIVTAALSLASAAPTGLPHPRIARLRRHPGQIETAAALRALLGGEGAPAAAPGAGLDAMAVFPQMGTCLDLLRQAGGILEYAANAVSEERLVLWQTGEIVEGIHDPAPVALAADLIALALSEIGALAERRLAVLQGSPQRVEGAKRRPGPRTPLAMAAGFNAENAERVRRPGLEPSGAGLEDIRRLLPMAGTASLVLAIECILAARASRPARDDAPDVPLSAVHALLRERLPGGADEGIAATDLALAAELVRSGALTAAAGLALPGVADPPPAPQRRLASRPDRS